MGLETQRLQETALPFAEFMRRLPQNRDLAQLQNDHRIFHAWASQLIQARGRKTFIKNWNFMQIKQAHDALVNHMLQLNPRWKHKTPIVIPAQILRP